MTITALDENRRALSLNLLFDWGWFLLHILAKEKNTVQVPYPYKNAEDI